MHHIDEHAHLIFDKLVKRQPLQVQRRGGCLLHRNDSALVVRPNIAHRGIRYAHQLHRLVHETVDDGQNRRRELHAALNVNERFARVTFYGNRLARAGVVAARELAARIYDLGETGHLDIHIDRRPELVYRDLRRDDLGHRADAVEAVLTPLPAPPHHRIASQAGVLGVLGHDVAHTAHRAHRPVLFPEPDKLGTEQVAVILVSIDKLAALVGLNALPIGHAVFLGLAPHLLDRSASGDDDIGLGLHLARRRVAEDDVRVH